MGERPLTGQVLGIVCTQGGRVMWVASKKALQLWDAGEE